MHTNQRQVRLDLGLDADNGRDDGLDDDDHVRVVTGVRAGVANHGKSGGGGLDGAESGARGDGGQADGGKGGLGLVPAQAGDGDGGEGAGVVDRSGHGGANREGGEGSAEELHCAGLKRKAEKLTGASVVC